MQAWLGQGIWWRSCRAVEMRRLAVRVGWVQQRNDGMRAGSAAYVTPKQTQPQPADRMVVQELWCIRKVVL